MKRIIKFLSGLAIVAANLVAIVHIVLVTAPGRSGTDWNAWVELMQARRWHFFMGGIFFFLLWMLYVWSRYAASRPRERFLTFDSDQGPVSISTHAIADFLARLTSEFPSIIRIEPRVIPRHGMIDVFLNVRVKSGTQINEMCHLLQQRVRRSLIDEMGIPEVNDIRININGIAGEHRVI